MSGASPSSDIPPKIQTPAIMANFESMLSALEKSFMPAYEVCAIIIFHFTREKTEVQRSHTTVLRLDSWEVA